LEVEALVAVHLSPEPCVQARGNRVSFLFCRLHNTVQRGAAIFVSVIAVVSTFGQTTPRNPNSALMAELGCANCHGVGSATSAVRNLAPDLGSAGLRYNPAYLFEFLRKPARVRQHIGRARMPDFKLGDGEALALVAFLETQRTLSGSWPVLPPALQTSRSNSSQALSASELARAKTETVVCLTCHTLEGKGGHRAVEWANVGYRLQPDAVKRLLVDPGMFGVLSTNMPPLFYHLSNDRKSFEQNAPAAAEKIQLITDYLFSLNREKRQAIEKSYLAAKARIPQATAAAGEAIFRALNCAACHRHPTIAPRSNAAPDLTFQGDRATQSWLRGYLKQPTAIRLFGYSPGDGARMPDFHLSDAEAAELAGFFTSASNQEAMRTNLFHPQKLSAFARNKAKVLLAEKLSCLGCHRLGEQGGQIGPDLTQAHVRLQPEYVYRMVKDPRAVNPQTIMPQVPLPPGTAELIVNYLLQQDPPSLATSYPSLLEMPRMVNSTASATQTAAQYVRYCGPCHGPEGRGDGFNARFLPRAPTVHADANYMSTRPDDTLFDGVASGGAILNRSHFMPAWGNTLSPSEIRGLVRHMRTLCRCDGPAWSLEKEKRP
jgi:mono/diheme cytochrome c family protein